MQLQSIPFRIRNAMSSNLEIKLYTVCASLILGLHMKMQSGYKVKG